MEGDISDTNNSHTLPYPDNGEWNCLYGHILKTLANLNATATGSGEGSSGTLNLSENSLLNSLLPKSSIEDSGNIEGGVIGGNDYGDVVSSSGVNEFKSDGDDLIINPLSPSSSWSSEQDNSRLQKFILQASDIINKAQSSGSSGLGGSGSGGSVLGENLVLGGGSGSGKGNFCNRNWDGLLCWPETLEGNSVSLQCFKHFNGIFYDEAGTVTRLCEKGGLWQNKTTDYSECIAKTTPTTEPPIGTHDVYFAGYCLSLFALLIAIVIFLAFKELRCLRNTIHSNLIITYILADALWLITSIQSHLVQGQGSCITFILLHYFHLTNFFFMFVEGLYLYVLVVQTFMAENVKFRVYASIGWGLPLLVVIVWLSAKWLTQSPLPVSSGQKLDGDGESENFSCVWLNVSAYDWIYKSPAIIVLAANSIFLLQIMWVLITKLRSATSPETQQSRKAAKALVVLMPLLGITYVLVLRGSSQTPAYEIIRALLISTQGFLVALLYCFLNGEVRKALRHRWTRLRSMGPNWCDERGMHMQSIRDWSPRSRTESIRLYTPPRGTPNSVYRKRESCISETTAVTTVLGANNSNNNGGNHNLGLGGVVVGDGAAQPLIVTMTGGGNQGGGAGGGFGLRRLSSATGNIMTKTYNSTDNTEQCLL